MTSRPFRRAGAVVAILLGLILLIGLVGWVGDMVARRSARQLRDESLLYFSQFKEMGYQKPAYYPDMKDGNAWDIYAKTVAAAESLDEDRQSYLHRLPIELKYVGDTAAVESMVTKCSYIIGYIKEGTDQSRFTIPVSYEEGLARRLPYYSALRIAAKLMACRAQLTAREYPRSAVTDMIDGAILGQDISGGDLTLIGHMMGIVCLGIARTEMHHALSRFYLQESELARLATTMNTLTKTWPPLSRNLEAEWRIVAISLSKLPFRETRLYFSRLTSQVPGPSNHWWVEHLRSWRYLFSARRARLEAVYFLEDMVRELDKAELKGWSAVDSTTSAWLSKAKVSGNWVLQLNDLLFALSMYRRQMEGIAHVRLAGAAALVELFFLRNRSWPDSLSLVKRDGLEDLLIDPMADELLKYVTYPGDDSVAVYSVGTNMVDDGGIMGGEREDLVLVLHRPGRSH